MALGVLSFLGVVGVLIRYFLLLVWVFLVFLVELVFLHPKGALLPHVSYWCHFYGCYNYHYYIYSWFL